MSYVLVTISGGLIDRVMFYDQAPGAIRALYRYVKTMDPDENDAAVYGPDELIANAKIFLDKCDLCIEKEINPTTILMLFYS